MILTATRAGFSCISDTVLGQGQIVGYGTEVIVARYSCEVELTGVTCRDRVSGRASCSHGSRPRSCSCSEVVELIPQEGSAPVGRDVPDDVGQTLSSPW